MSKLSGDEVVIDVVPIIVELTEKLGILAYRGSIAPVFNPLKNEEGSSEHHHH